MKTLNGKFWESAYTLAAGEMVTHVIDGCPASMQVFALDDSAQVQFTVAPRALVDAGTAQYDMANVSDTPGIVVGIDSVDLPAPTTAVKVTAGEGVVTVYVREML